MRGRKSYGPNAGSLNEWLSTFTVGEVRYREADSAAAYAMMQRITLASRRPDFMRAWRFKSMRVLVVPTDAPLEPYCLLRVERIE